MPLLPSVPEEAQEPGPTNPGDFTWDLVPDDLCVRVARQLNEDITDVESARAMLAARHPVPDDPLLRSGPQTCDVAHVIRDMWPVRNPAVLEHMYGLAESHGLIAPSKRVPAQRTMVKRLRSLRLQVNFRRAILDTLLRFGSRTAPTEALQDLPSFFVVPTDVGASVVELFPYQAEAVGRMVKRFKKDGFGTRGLIVMPTGSGKTRTAVSWLLDDVVGRGHKVLWVTHRTELMQQTARTFVACAQRLEKSGRSTLAIRLVGGGYSPGSTVASGTHDVAIAAVGTLARNRRSLQEWLAANDVVVVFDEAHHSPAKTWRDILRTAAETTGDAVIGLTATPMRMGEESSRALIGLYGGEGDGKKAIIHQSRVEDLIDEGYLARPTPVVLETSIDVLEDATDADLDLLAEFGKLSPRLATQLANHAGRNRLIVETWLEGPQADGATYGSAIIFALNIPHAELLAERFREAGVEADAVHSKRAEAENRDNLDRFRSGELSVLVNVEMLTEGVDVPHVRTVVLARPTQSPVLFSQMVGRAMRGEKVGGTRDAYVVDLHDLWSAFPPMSVVDGDMGPEPPTPAAGPTIAVPGLLELAIRVGRLHERLTTSTLLGRFDAIPIGILSFDVDVDDPDDSISSVERNLVVHAQNEPGYDRIREMVAANDLAGLRRATDWREEFFGDLAPAPLASDLSALRHHVLDTSIFPVLHRFDERDAIDPQELAKRLAQTPTSLPELNDEIDTVVSQNLELIEHAWDSGANYAAEVMAEVNRLVRGDDRHPVDARLPRIRVPDLREWPHGAGFHDLAAALADLLSDRALFPGGIEPPDTIIWSKDGRSHWGLYVGDQRSTRIVINTLLDSEQVDPRVISALVYHELLHHEQWLGGNRIGHGPAFKRREEQHPDYPFAAAFLDTFHERFAPDG